MSSKQKELQKGKNSWLRAGFIAFTVVGPTVANLLSRLREQQETVTPEGQGLSKKIQSLQDNAVERLDQITQLGRQRTVEQIQNLQSQSLTLQKQVNHLRKTLRRELKQRNKLAKRLRKASRNWNKEMLQRGEDLREELLDRGSQITHDLTVRGGKLTHDLTDRGSKLTHDLTDRGSKLTHDLTDRGGKLTQTFAERSSQLTQDLAGRSEQLLQQRRRPNRLTMIVGFSLGAVGAGVATYLFIRRRTTQLQTEELNQQIELPRTDYLNGGSSSRPAGEIVHLDRETSSIATLPAVEVETTDQQIPDNAAFVGHVESKLYYPLGTELDTAEVIYFITEEEAKALGFTSGTEE
jgi:gas vesicle protein